MISQHITILTTTNHYDNIIYSIYIGYTCIRHSSIYTAESLVAMGAVNKDSVFLGTSLVLSVTSLVLLFGVIWYFKTSLDLLQQQVDHDREVLLKVL